MKIKNILIPTDFSENARNAIDFTIRFFENDPVNYFFLHVYHVPVVTPEMPADIIYKTIEENQKIAKKALSDLCRELRSSYGELSCEFLIKQEPLKDAVSDTVKEKAIDLVAMGTHGASGLKKFLFGSNAASMIGSVPCPVIAVPGEARFHQIKSMLFATDYHDSDLEDIAHFAGIAKKFGAELIITHIAEAKESDRTMLHWFEELARKRTDYPKLLFLLLGKSDVAQALDNFIRDNSVELLAMSVRHRTAFGKLFSASVTKKMVYHTHIPLFAYHSRESGGDIF